MSGIPLKVGTHDGTYHADDVMASAIITLAFPDSIITTVRTRNHKELASCDIVFDVGGTYDTTKGQFDHHMRMGAGKRVNGVPYSSAGLLWKYYGYGICERLFSGTDTEQMFDAVDASLIQPIDAIDNGFDPYAEAQADAPFEILTISRILHSFNPTWKESDLDTDKAFDEASALALLILKRSLAQADSVIDAKSQIGHYTSKLDNPNVLVMDKNIPWESVVVQNHPDILYVVFPGKGKSPSWRVQCVPKSVGALNQRKSFPSLWFGLMDEDLANVTGVQDAVFCHKNGFISVATSKEGAIQLATLASESSQRMTVNPLKDSRQAPRGS